MTVKKNLFKVAPSGGPGSTTTNNPYKVKLNSTGSNNNNEVPLSPPPPPSTSVSLPAPTTPTTAGLHVVEALYDHQGDTNDGELSLALGARYVIIDSSKPDGWWEAYKEDDPSQRGLVPSNFLKKVC